MEQVVVCADCGKKFSMSDSSRRRRESRGTDLTRCFSCLRKKEYLSGRRARLALTSSEILERIPVAAREYYLGSDIHITPSGNHHTILRFKCPICKEPYTIGFSNLRRRKQFACPSCSSYKFNDEAVKNLIPPGYKRFFLRREYLSEKGHTLYWFSCSQCARIFNIQDSALSTRRARRCLCPSCMETYYGKFISGEKSVLTIRDNFRRNSARYWHYLGVKDEGRDAHHIIPYSLCIRNHDYEFAMSPLNCAYLTREAHHNVHNHTPSDSFQQELIDLFALSFLEAKRKVISDNFQERLLSYVKGEGLWNK